MIKNVASIGLSLAICLLFCEIAMRIFGIAYPTFYRPDPVLGFALRPGAKGWYRKEGEGYVEVNAAGYRGIEVPPQKSAQDYRVAVLGDSFALGLEVMNAQTFAARTEKALSTCAGLEERRVSVLNFGAAGYGTAQELLLYRDKVRAYKPDVVVLAFFSGNDVRNNSRLLQADPMRPYFTLDDNALVLDDAFLTSAAYQRRTHVPLSLFYDLVNHVRLFQLVNEARQAIRYALQNAQQARQATEGETPPQQALAEAGLDLLALTSPRDKNWRDAWDVTDALVQTLAQDVRADGAQFIAMTISNAIQVSPDAAKRQAVIAALGAQDLRYADARIQALGRAHGFPVIDLAMLMQPVVAETGTYFHGFKNTAMGTGHYNADGHAFAGQALADTLCAQLTAPTP